MTMREIHPQAVVAANAKLGEGVKIGAYAVVGEGVELGDGCVLHTHAMLTGPAPNWSQATATFFANTSPSAVARKKAAARLSWATTIFFWPIRTSVMIA